VRVARRFLTFVLDPYLLHPALPLEEEEEEKKRKKRAKKRRCGTLQASSAG
jgi:hypothetical protein